jgi:hypothetical protein
MYTLEQAEELQQDFAYIIEKERRNGMETGQNCITLFFNHGGVVREYYRDRRVEATIPKDKKYLELKAKYFPDTNRLSIFYPYEFKKYLDNDSKV